MGHPSEGSSRRSDHACVWRIACALPPSEPHTVGPTPGVSDGPTIAAPAPSPRRNEIERSVGSMKSLIFSAPTTSTCVAMPARTRASACAMA
ncbi:Uncharacterised protein [Mycobacteroides abscessus]|nr:Uncharacterised protein [Mycobacteroides abscessus]